MNRQNPGQRAEKFQVMLKILFYLLRMRKTNATYLANTFGVSKRTIFRYIDELSASGVPILVTRGKYGGIAVRKEYTLPNNFFTEAEYKCAIEGLDLLNSQLNDNAALSARDKLIQQQKKDNRDLSVSGNIIVDSGTWGDVYDFSDKLKQIQNAIEENSCIHIDYSDRQGEQTSRIVEPHFLVYKQNVWYTYAYCRKREDFRLFNIGRIVSMHMTDETFERRKVDRKNIPLNFSFSNADVRECVFKIEKSVLADVQEWIGVDRIRQEGDCFIGTASLPVGEVLYSKILSFSSGLKVIRPVEIAEEVKKRAAATYKNYM